MGAVCCKQEHATSPPLPFCEMVRRCARLICPIDPPQQKPIFKTRKLGPGELAAPASRRDSSTQTDPLPPPRQRRRGKQRRRSRSAEFLPYVLQREEEAARKAAGSLGDIPGQEDVIDFQMYFIDCFPPEDGKGALQDKKKEFLSGLLGEENNNLVASESESEQPKTGEEVGKADLEKPSDDLQKLTTNVVSDPDPLSSNSRRSSITESLREFESSLLEMLEEEEFSLTRTKEQEQDSEDEVVRMMVPVKRKDLPPLVEVKEEEYMVSPLEEEEGEGGDCNFVLREAEDVGPSQGSNETGSSRNETGKNEGKGEGHLSYNRSEGKQEEKLPDTAPKINPISQPPAITIEIVS